MVVGEPELLTVAEASKILRLNEQTIRRHLATGEIVGARFGRVWRIDRDSLTRPDRGAAQRNHTARSGRGEA